MVGTSLYAPGDPFRPGAGVGDRDVFAVTLVEHRHGNGHVVFAGDLDDGIDVLEISLVGRERIVVDPGLVTVAIRLGAVANAHEHDLGKGKALALGLLKNRPRILLAIPAEEFPLGRAHPEYGVALLVDKVPAVVAHFDGMHGFRCRCAGRQQEYPYQKPGFFEKPGFCVCYC